MTLTEIFVNQNRIIICEHTVKMVPMDICEHQKVSINFPETSATFGKCFPFLFLFLCISFISLRTIRILRMYGPTQNNGIYRIQYNSEVYKLYRDNDIATISFIFKDYNELFI